MADDKGKQGAGDRSQVAADEGYEVAYFARKHGLSQDEARTLIERVGNDREKLDAAAAARSAAPDPKAGKRSASPVKGRSGTSPAPAVKAPAKPRAKGVAKVAEAALSVTAPMAERAAPAANRIADAAKSAVSVARRSSASVRRGVATAPAKAKNRAGKVADGVQSAARGRTAAVLGAAAAGLAAGLAVNLGRKVIVQAPSVMAGDWFEAIKTEHALALALFDQIQKTTDAEPAKRTLFLTQLKHALGKHAFTEENVVYPALRDWGDKADADKLNHDHGYVKQYLYDLEAIEHASPAFLEKIAAFRADLEAHIREEEDAIFPPLHAGLDEKQNAKLTVLANKEGFKLA